MRNGLLIAFLLFSAMLNAQVRKICDLVAIPEVSGSILVNQKIWCMPDGGNAAALYLFDSSQCQITDTTTFANAGNEDWEEIAQNSSQVFIGDFGNNDGVRKNLKIFRFNTSQLGSKNIVCDTITFFYPKQTNFNANILTIYDCEAMVAGDDSIYIFSKSYADALCRIYKIPNKKGHFPAEIIDSIQLDFWVTGASIQGTELALVGYGFNGKLTPALWRGKFIHGKITATNYQKSLATNGPLQVESCIILSNKVLFTAEASNGENAALFEFIEPVNIISAAIKKPIIVSPNPSMGHITVSNPSKLNIEITICTMEGKIARILYTNSVIQTVNISYIPSGVYAITVSEISTDTSIKSLIYSEKLVIE